MIAALGRRSRTLAIAVRSGGSFCSTCGANRERSDEHRNQ
jgi:hypothetical protein